MADQENADLESSTPSYPKNWDTLPGQAPKRSDEEIKRDVETALFYHPDVRSYEVHVQVQNGVVTLTGTVDDDIARMAAEDQARVVPGVVEARNLIQVKSGAKG